MTPKLWVLWAALTLVSVLAIRGVRPLWRHETTLFDTMPEWWFWGPVLWRGWVRSLPLVGIIAVLFPVGMLVVRVWESDSAVVFLVMMLILFIVFVLGASIMLFNQPKALVAPHLRDQPGAIEEWQQGYRRRRAERGSARGGGTRV